MQLLKALDGNTILAETDFDWNLTQTDTFRLRAQDQIIQPWIDDRPLFAISEDKHPLDSRGLGFVFEEDHSESQAIRLSPNSVCNESEKVCYLENVFWEP